MILKIYCLMFIMINGKVNLDGVYMFLCDKKRYREVKDKNKDLNFIIVIDGYGFEIPMRSLFEKTTEDDYEFFIHFREFEQNFLNIRHHFFPSLYNYF